MKTLYRGSTGTEVRELQELLNLAGAGLTVDGDFGTKTYNAVIIFQKANGLTADGIVGAKTWTKLQAYKKPATKETAIDIINQCVNEMMKSPNFQKLMEMIEQ